MEAAGIEPASESIWHRVTTCLSSSLFSSPVARRGRASVDQPRRCFAHRPQDRTGSLSRRVGAPEAPRERTPGTACLSIRPRLLKVRQLKGSTSLTRWVGPRHATRVSLPPSKPVRPHTPFASHYTRTGRPGANAQARPGLKDGTWSLQIAFSRGDVKTWPRILRVPGLHVSRGRSAWVNARYLHFEAAGQIRTMTTPCGGTWTSKRSL